MSYDQIVSSDHWAEHVNSCFWHFHFQPYRADNKNVISLKDSRCFTDQSVACCPSYSRSKVLSDLIEDLFSPATYNSRARPGADTGQLLLESSDIANTVLNKDKTKTSWAQYILDWRLHLVNGYVLHWTFPNVTDDENVNRPNHGEEAASCLIKI